MNGKLRNMTAIYLLKGEQILLLYRQGGKVVNNVWTGSAGGHFEPEELNDPKACVLRELKEELGLLEKDIDGLAMRYITLRRTNGEIRQNYYFFAKLKEEVDENLISTEGTCKWFSVNEIHELEMPFSAKYIVEHFCKIGRFTDKVYIGVTNSEGEEFIELQEC